MSLVVLVWREEINPACGKRLRPAFAAVDQSGVLWLINTAFTSRVKEYNNPY
jgi:hypothetical protein